MAIIDSKNDGALAKILSGHLEADINSWEVVTHKKIGDNLRCYPIIILFAVALPYMWSVTTISGKPFLFVKISAILWAAWIFWYALLTVIQTFRLFSGLVPGIIGSLHATTGRGKRALKVFLLFASLTLSGFFLFGIGALVWVLYSHTPKP